MVDAKHMTPEEAQARLIELQEKTRQRQRDYVERKQKDGLKRINTFVSAEAGKILEREQEDTGKTISDILSDALLIMAQHKATTQTATLPLTQATQAPPVSSHKPVTGYDREGTEKRIAELAAGGEGPAAIARQLDAEGYPTATGKPNWYKGTVSKIIKRITDEAGTS